MECPNCGQENRDVARFCQHCGASLAIMEPAVVEPVETLESAPLPEQNEPSLDPAAGTDLMLEPAGDELQPAIEPAPACSEQEPEWVKAAPLSEAAKDHTPDAEPSPMLEAASDATTGQSETVPPIKVPEPVSSEQEGPETASPDTPQNGGLEPIPDETPDEGQEPEQPLVHRPLVKEQELADAHLLPGNDAPPSLHALEPGTVLNGRYQVSEIIDGPGTGQPSQILYRVRDLQRCPRCGAAGHSPDEAFCMACGALMDQKPAALMVQQSAAAAHAPKSIVPEDHFTEGENNYWVWRQDPPEETVPQEKPLMRLLVGLQSDTGQVRELDEDSMFALTMTFTYESVTHQLGLFIVADGMGGHEGGEVASRLAIQTTAPILLRDLFGPELAGIPLATDEILDRIDNAVRQANDAVYLERQKRDNDMGTTLTAAFVKDWSLHIGHVGDCRAYRWGKQGLQQLTTDHSIVAGMVAAGAILPEEIYTHPQRSVIYRCIGDQPTVEVDLVTVKLAPEERLLVCCDGLWEMLRSEGIEDILLAEADPQTACDSMVHQANLAGGSDNISVIIVQL